MHSLAVLPPWKRVSEKALERTSMHIKICGITTMEDALAAAQLGADFLGFNFYPKSPRFISPGDCNRIVSELRHSFPVIKTVGIFVNLGQIEIMEILRACHLDMAQLSGDEPVSLLEALTADGIHAYKALRGPVARELVESFANPARKHPSLLLDGMTTGMFGGSGKTADWEAAASIAKQHPIFLAGGLTAENVASAIQQVRPWGVDTASGVESLPGRKDATKMAAFLHAVKESDPVGSFQVETANRADAAEILALQKLAFQNEAMRNNDFSIPPLTQTLSELIKEFDSKCILKAKRRGQIIGSVRAEISEGTCKVGRLMVHPDCQNHGIGSRLMREIEARFPTAQRYELFTGEGSARNIYLYQELGYKIFARKALNQNVTLVYFEKARLPSI
jgi:phosphoribosylanthranilate isomerase